MAARDVHKTNIVVLPPSRHVPESELQADFERHTGICCCKAARERLESLMQSHGFHKQELSATWRAQYIGWDHSAQRIRVHLSRVEHVGAWTMLLLSIAFLLLAASVWFKLGAHRTWDMNALMLSAASAYVFVVWWVSARVIQPRRVALRVRAAMQGLQEAL